MQQARLGDHSRPQQRCGDQAIAVGTNGDFGISPAGLLGRSGTTVSPNAGLGFTSEPVAEGSAKEAATTTQGDKSRLRLFEAMQQQQARLAQASEVAAKGEDQEEDGEVRFEAAVPEGVCECV